jgi:two-component SAPR family response regulator
MASPVKSAPIDTMRPFASTPHLPDMNGRRLAEAALKLRPNLKLLYTTGYTRNAVVHRGVLDPGVNFIAKPFTFDRLGQKIREVLS